MYREPEPYELEPIAGTTRCGSSPEHLECEDCGTWLDPDEDDYEDTDSGVLCKDCARLRDSEEE